MIDRFNESRKHIASGVVKNAYDLMGSILFCVGNKNKVTENSNLKKNDKRTIQVQVQNIDSNLNSSPTSKKRVKNKSISVKNPKE